MVSLLYCVTNKAGENSPMFQASSDNNARQLVMMSAVTNDNKPSELFLFRDNFELLRVGEFDNTTLSLTRYDTPVMVESVKDILDSDGFKKYLGIVDLLNPKDDSLLTNELPVEFKK